MYQDDRTRCVACRTVAKALQSFGALMEMPFKHGQPTIGDAKDNQPQKSVVASSSKEDLGAPNPTILKFESDVVGEGAFILPASRLQRLALSGRKDASLEISALVAEGAGHYEKVASDNGRTVMQIAVSLGDIDLLEKLIAADINVNELPCANNGRTALQAAVERGDLAIVTRLLAAGADPNGPVSLSGGLSALEGAAKIGHIGILALLLQHGASIRNNRKRRSALHCAAENGHETAVAILLAYGFDPEAYLELPNDEGRKTRFSLNINFTPSEMAAKNGHIGVLRVLRKNGVVTNPISTACQYGHVPIVEWLLDDSRKREAEKFDIQTVNDQDDDEDEEDAIYQRYYRQSRIFKSTDDYGYPKREGLEGTLDQLLEIAAEHGQLEVLKLLLDNGAILRVPGSGSTVDPDPEFPDEETPTFYDSTLLHKAAKSSSVETVAYLLTQGFELEETRVYQEKTPLMVAAEEGRYATFEFLVAKGANVHAVSKSGQTLAIIAARGGSEDILRLLFRHNVDLTKIGSYSESALAAALSSGHDSIARLILEQLDKHSEKSGYNACLSGALDVAATMANLPFIRKLIARGTDLDFNISLQHMRTFIREEVNEDDAIECVRLLSAKGGTFTDLSRILNRLEQAGRSKLATVFVQSFKSCPPEKDIKWVEHIESAAKMGDAEYAGALIRAYRRSLGEKDGQALIPRHWTLQSAFSAAIDHGQLEIVDLILEASTTEDARKYVDGVSRLLGPKDHARRYLEERYVLKPLEDVPRYQTQQYWSDRFRRPGQLFDFDV
ncbi:hypothetical protein ONS96_011131 [Cadophora gregata f. sp. sojae]|nr:hypothetical protein ONS96_011131 [Cadophora gregata f. sp. sojae]